MTEAGPKFLLDANVLITAHRLYYAFDICPGYWDAIKAGHAAGRIYSTQRVLAELRRGADILVDWVEQELPADFFLDDSAESVISAYAPMMQRVQSRDYTPAAKTKFANDADGWLVATAKQDGHVVVTHETRNDAKARVPMPNVCEHFGVTYCDTYEMLRALACSFR
jgi:predicted nucleic acid-binding protein